MQIRPGKLNLLVALFVLLAGTTTITLSVKAFAQSGSRYVLSASNEANRNIVRFFTRQLDGTLVLKQRVSTRGRGTGSFLTNQNGLIVVGQDVLVVNAGSNELSLLRFVRGSLRFISKVAINGVRPLSVARFGDLVFVASDGDTDNPANISGYRLTGNVLSPITGATALLSDAAAGPAQISFSPLGTALVVTERSTDVLSVFPVDSVSGLLGERQTFNSSGQQPWGFEFSKQGFLIVSEAFQGADSAVSSYSLSSSLALSVVSPSVDAGRETDACWIAITSDGKRAYTTNTNVGTISSYSIGNSGELALRNSRAARRGGLPIDLDLSSNDRFMYVLNIGSNRIESYSVNRRSGNLRLLQTVPVPGSSNGISAR